MKADCQIGSWTDLFGALSSGLALEEAVTKVSKLFVSTHLPDLNEVLQIIGSALGINGAYIFLFREKGRWMDSTHAWFDLSPPLPLSKLQNLDTSLFPWGITQLFAQDVLIIPDTQQLPIEAKTEQEILQKQGVRSLLAVPINSPQNEEQVGFIGFVETRYRREWSNQEAGLLQLVADMLASYFARKQSEEVTGQMIRRYRALFEAAPVMYVITRHSEKGSVVINCNQAFLQTLGYNRAEVLGRQLAAFYTPESRARVLAKAKQPITSDYVDVQDCQLLTRNGEVIETFLQAVAELDVNGRVFGTRVMYVDITEHKQAEAEIARLYQAEQARYREVETLYRTTLTLVSSLDLNQVIERLLIELQHVIPYDSASVQLFRANRMEIIGGRGFPNLPEILGFSYSIEGDTPNALVINSREPVILENVQTRFADQFNQPPHDEAKVKAWLGVPLLIGDRVIGMLTLDKQQPDFYTAAHAQLAKAYAAQAAIAIENADLYAELDQRVSENSRLYQQAQ